MDASPACSSKDSSVPSSHLRDWPRARKGCLCRPNQCTPNPDGGPYCTRLFGERLSSAISRIRSGCGYMREMRLRERRERRERRMPRWRVLDLLHPRHRPVSPSVRAVRATRLRACLQKSAAVGPILTQSLSQGAQLASSSPALFQRSARAAGRCAPSPSSRPWPPRLPNALRELPGEGQHSPNRD